MGAIVYNKGKGSPYPITQRRVPVLGSQPAGDVSYKPGCRLPLGYFAPGLRLTPQPLLLRVAGVATNFAAWWTEAQ